MRLTTLGLRDFRNIAEARVRLEGRRHFFLGANGQGKTNLLEAAGCLTALRSFRTSDTKALIRSGTAEAAIAADLEHEHRGATSLRILFRSEGKELWSDGEKVRRLGDHLGHFPVVAFSSHDLQLLRGSPALRRRWLDLTLAAMDAAYLQALQTYARALAGRNQLLKSASPDDAELAAFEQVLAPAAATVQRLRVAGLAEIGVAVADSYRTVSGAAEAAHLGYEAPAGSGEPGYWIQTFASGRANDIRLRSTLRGPHRDDLGLLIAGQLARDFASEGQQRSFVLALRLAQAAWFQAKSRARPVILADDVLGELDPDRRRRFWSALDPDCQVLATGTSLPDRDLGEWQVFQATAGKFMPAL
ncbi:MAG TPA: DNA replication and repair protein RecF [Opitutaceae bacterium]|jgi:DNA replication and repair protein RecF